eukprot:6190504-Pleurochrysis_carterae.AAC.2
MSPRLSAVVFFIHPGVPLPNLPRIFVITHITSTASCSVCMESVRTIPSSAYIRNGAPRDPFILNSIPGTSKALHDCLYYG